MANLNFRWGKYSDFQSQVVTGNKAKEGTIYVATHENNRGASLFIGVDGGKTERIQGTVLFFSDLAEFHAKTQPPYSEDVIYFLAANNALVRWTGTEWIQLNVTADTFTADLDKINKAVDANTTAIALNAGAIETNKNAIAANLEAIQGNGQAISALQGRMDAVDGENGKLADHEGRIKGLEDVVGDANKGLVADVASHTSTLAQQANTLTDHNTRITANDTLAKANKAAIESNDADILALQNRMTAVDDAKDGTVAKLTARVVTLEDFKTSTETLLGTMDGRITAAQNQADKGVADALANKNALDALTGRVKVVEDDLNTAETGIKDRLTAVEGKANSNANSISSLDTTVAGIAGRVGTAEGNITTLQGQMTNLIKENGRLDQIEGAANALTDRVKAVEDDLNTATTGVKAKLEKVISDAAGLESTLGQTNTKLGKAEEAIQDHAGRIGDLETASGNHNTAIENLNDAIDNINEIIGAGTGGDSLTGRVGKLESDLSALDATVAGIDGKVGDNAKDIEALDGRVTALDKATTGRVAVVEAKAAANEGKIADNAAAIAGHKTRIEAVETKASANETAIAGLNTNKADKTYVDGIKSDLQNQIAADINAANSLSYQGGIASDTLPAAGENNANGEKLKIGDTYIVTGAFEVSNVEGATGKVMAYPGDLLIATGTETAGAISGNLKWVHVQSGYVAEHEAHLTIAEVTDNKVVAASLSSHVNPLSGDLGKLTLKAVNENMTIDVVDGVVEINNVWLGFTD
jgi:chromosome segregation ATPase